MGKNKWQKLGLTPRQFSKKIGVTYSMAKFITQSYRTPVSCCPKVVCACSSLQKQKNSKKSNCTSNITHRGRGRKLPDCVTPPVSCSRKRGRAEEELNVCDDPSTSYAWTQTKEIYEHTDFSQSSGKRRTCKDGCKISRSIRCRRPCKKSRITSPPKKCSKRQRPKPGRKRAISKKAAPKSQQKKTRMIPININLDMPLNIIVDDDDCATLEKQAPQCKKRKTKSDTVPMPCLYKETEFKMVDAECQRLEESLKLWRKECENEEGTTVDDCDLSEDQSSSERVDSEDEGKVDCNQETKAAEDGYQFSLCEKIQEYLSLLESFLNYLIKKQ